MINQAPRSMQAFNCYDVLTEMHSCRMNRGNTFDVKKAVRCGKIHHSIIKKNIYALCIFLCTRVFIYRLYFMAVFCDDFWGWRGVSVSPEAVIS